MVCLPIEWYRDGLIHISRIAVLGKYAVQSYSDLSFVCSEVLCSPLGLWDPGSLGHSGAGGAEGVRTQKGVDPLHSCPIPLIYSLRKPFEPLSYPMYYASVGIMPDPCPQGTHTETCKYMSAI